MNWTVGAGLLYRVDMEINIFICDSLVRDVYMRACPHTPPCTCIDVRAHTHAHDKVH